MFIEPIIIKIKKWETKIVGTLIKKCKGYLGIYQIRLDSSMSKLTSFT